MSILASNNNGVVFSQSERYPEPTPSNSYTTNNFYAKNYHAQKMMSNIEPPKNQYGYGPGSGKYE